MDYTEDLAYDDDDEGEGVRHFVRVVANLDGHTHVYQFPVEESRRAQLMVRLHVEEGVLHPYAGLILNGMIREAERELGD